MTLRSINTLLIRVLFGRVICVQLTLSRQTLTSIPGQSALTHHFLSVRRKAWYVYPLNSAMIAVRNVAHIVISFQLLHFSLYHVPQVLN